MQCNGTLLVRAAFCWFGMVAYAHAGVLNGGFETGSFTNWTQFGDTSFSDVIPGPACLDGGTTVCTPHSGLFAAFFGNPTSGGISQSFVTVPGTPYEVGFWLFVDVHGSGPAGTEYKVSWDSTVLTDTVDAPAAPWQFLSFTAIAGGTTSVLTFQFLNSPDSFGLDDVSVNAVPEPVSSILAGTALLALAGLRRVLRRC